MEQGDPAKAAEILRHGLSMPQGPAELTIGSGVSMVAVKMRADLALMLYQLGQLDESAVQCDMVLKDDPSNTYAHTTLGHIFNQKGRLEEAIGQYREGL